MQDNVENLKYFEKDFHETVDSHAKLFSVFAQNEFFPQNFAFILYQYKTCFAKKLRIHLKKNVAQNYA